MTDEEEHKYCPCCGRLIKDIEAKLRNMLFNDKREREWEGHTQFKNYFKNLSTGEYHLYDSGKKLYSGVTGKRIKK